MNEWVAYLYLHDSLVSAVAKVKDSSMNKHTRLSTLMLTAEHFTETSVSVYVMFPPTMLHLIHKFLRMHTGGVAFMLLSVLKHVSIL